MATEARPAGPCGGNRREDFGPPRKPGSASSGVRLFRMERSESNGRGSAVTGKRPGPLGRGRSKSHPGAGVNLFCEPNRALTESIPRRAGRENGASEKQGARGNGSGAGTLGETDVLNLGSFGSARPRPHPEETGAAGTGKDRSGNTVCGGGPGGGAGASSFAENAFFPKIPIESAREKI